MKSKFTILLAYKSKCPTGPWTLAEVVGRRLRLLMLLVFVVLGWSGGQAVAMGKTSADVQFEEEDEISATDLVGFYDLVITQPRSSGKKSSSPSKALATHSYRYTQASQVRTGGWFDPGEFVKDKKIPLILGVGYLFPRRQQPQFEVQFDWTTDDEALLSAGWRQTGYPNTGWRPFVRAHLATKLKPEELLATLAKYENLRLKIGFGFESSINQRTSWTMGVDGVFGLEEIVGVGYLGMTFGW